MQKTCIKEIPEPVVKVIHWEFCKIRLMSRVFANDPEDWGSTLVDSYHRLKKW